MVAKSTRARKTKGQEFQKSIVAKLREKFMLDSKDLSCFEGDIQANPMGQSGVDIKLSPKAQMFIPFDIEAKRQENTSVWAWLKQAETNAGSGRIPLVVFKKNQSKTYAIIDLDDLLFIMD